MVVDDGMGSGGGGGGEFMLTWYGSGVKVTIVTWRNLRLQSSQTGKGTQIKVCEYVD
jgi:hypothetical protein